MPHPFCPNNSPHPAHSITNNDETYACEGQPFPSAGPAHCGLAQTHASHQHWTGGQWATCPGS